MRTQSVQLPDYLFISSIYPIVTHFFNAIIHTNVESSDRTVAWWCSFIGAITWEEAGRIRTSKTSNYRRPTLKLSRNAFNNKHTRFKPLLVGLSRVSIPGNRVYYCAKLKGRVGIANSLHLNEDFSSTGGPNIYNCTSILSYRDPGSNALKSLLWLLSQVHCLVQGSMI